MPLSIFGFGMSLHERLERNMAMILWALATIGLTLIVVESELTRFLRNWIGKPFTCYRCFGFWSGIICWLLIKPWWIEPVWERFLFGLAVGFAGSYLSVLGKIVLDWLEGK